MAAPSAYDPVGDAASYARNYIQLTAELMNMIKTLFKAFEVRWKSYRHRFVPWIALNLQKNQRYRKHSDVNKDEFT